MAGIALFTTILSALSSAVEEANLRLPAMITFLVGASGLALFSIGPGFWALAAGVSVWLALRKPATKTPS
jgi:benzoate membrane transport protein